MRNLLLEQIVVGFVAVCFGVGVGGCDGGPIRPFERNAPVVDHAITAFDAGDAGAAAELLEQFLQTGACTEAQIGVPGRVREMQNASFDLGLALFRLAERYGKRFGEEDFLSDAGPTPEQTTESQLRSDQVDCALRIVREVGNKPDLPVELRARVHYLEGNLEFLRRSYRPAVTAYDEVLKLIPGISDDAGDGIGRDAAWNRSIALRRIEEDDKRDAGKDAEQDSGSPDSGQESGSDSGKPDSGEDKKPDAGGPEGSDGKDAGKDSGGDEPAPQDQQPEAGAPDGASQPPPQNTNQDERVLDMLESAPTVQMQDARNRASRRRVRGMADK